MVKHHSEIFRVSASRMEKHVDVRPSKGNGADLPRRSSPLRGGADGDVSGRHIRAWMQAWKGRSIQQWMLSDHAQTVRMSLCVNVSWE